MMLMGWRRLQMVECHVMSPQPSQTLHAICRWRASWATLPLQQLWVHAPPQHDWWICGQQHCSAAPAWPRWRQQRQMRGNQSSCRCCMFEAAAWLGCYCLPPPNAGVQRCCQWPAPAPSQRQPLEQRAVLKGRHLRMHRLKQRRSKQQHPRCRHENYDVENLLLLLMCPPPAAEHRQHWHHSCPLQMLHEDTKQPAAWRRQGLMCLHCSEMPVFSRLKLPRLPQHGGLSASLSRACCRRCGGCWRGRVRMRACPEWASIPLTSRMCACHPVVCSASL